MYINKIHYLCNVDRLIREGACIYKSTFIDLQNSFQKVVGTMTDIIEKLGYLSSGSRLRRIYEKLQIDGDKAYKEAEINFKASWFPVYYVLAQSPAPQTVMGITNKISFSHITVKNIVKELEKEGLVEIAPNPDDKRSKLIQLSNSGQKLLKQLEPLWWRFSQSLEQLMTDGHPDIQNILQRIDRSVTKIPLNERVTEENRSPICILDYRPSLKKHFYQLAAPWLLDVLNGALETEDRFTLHNPDIAYVKPGGFVFFAQYQDKIVGCVALKRLDDDTFEFAKLFIKNDYRQLGIATKLIERCISRCIENQARELWLQTTMGMPKAHQLYYKLGFEDKEAPPQMEVLQRTEKIMYLDLTK